MPTRPADALAQQARAERGLDETVATGSAGSPAVPAPAGGRRRYASYSLTFKSGPCAFKRFHRRLNTDGFPFRSARRAPRRLGSLMHSRGSSGCRQHSRLPRRPRPLRHSVPLRSTSGAAPVSRVDNSLTSSGAGMNDIPHVTVYSKEAEGRGRRRHEVQTTQTGMPPFLVHNTVYKSSPPSPPLNELV